MNYDKTEAKSTDQEIAIQAYYLWETDGRLPGRDLEYWLRAKAQLTGSSQAESKPAAAPSPAEGAARNGASSPAEKSGKRRKTEQRPTSSKQPAFA